MIRASTRDGQRGIAHSLACTDQIIDRLAILEFSVADTKLDM